MVQWDQRGAGKTYASNDRELQRHTMTIHQMEQDALEVVNYLRHRFHQDKIFVLGHSWGTVLGLWLAHEHAELVAAYVGVAQAVNMEENERIAFQDALDAARARHIVDAIRALEDVRPYPPPHVDLRKGEMVQTWQAKLLGPSADRPRFIDVRRLLFTLLSAPEYSLVDVYGFTRGQMMSLETLVPETRKINVTTLGTDFRVPMVFFQGRLDPYNRPMVIQKYADTITAPHKEIVWFDDAGHFPFFEDRQRFSDALTSRVRPLSGN